MFGAAGVYLDDVMFGVCDDETLWLRADEVNSPLLQAAGARRFTFTSKDGTDTPTAFWSLPDSAADDPEEAVRWARGAVEAAMRKAAKGKKRKAR